MYFQSLSESSGTVAINSTVLKNVRQHQITGTTAAVEILPANDERKSLLLINRAKQQAFVEIVDETTSSETPLTGTTKADYSFIVPANSQGLCSMGTPTGAIKVFYEDTPDKEFVAVEGW